MSYKPAESGGETKMSAGKTQLSFRDLLKCLCKMQEALAYIGPGKHGF